MLKRTSLKDIAQAVGVSTALVSYVLNNQKQGRIGKEIAEKIRDAATRLNYRPNQIARSLKTNKTYTVGLIVADISNTFSSCLARIIEDEADNRGYTVLFGSSDENAHKSEKLIETFLNRQVDGLIIAPPAGSEPQLLQLQKQEVPIVLVDRYFPEIQAGSICLDNFSATYKAVKHLYGGGSKRIGMITYDSSLFHLQERKKGYLTAMGEHDGTVDFLQEVDMRNDQQAIEAAIRKLLTLHSPVDAIIFATNRLAITGLKYLLSLPLRVPDDLAVVGFDETESFDFFYSPLTYIRQPLKEMGQAALGMLISEINRSGEAKRIILEPELVIRQSSVRN